MTIGGKLENEYVCYSVISVSLSVLSLVLQQLLKTQNHPLHYLPMQNQVRFKIAYKQAHLEANIPLQIPLILFFDQIKAKFGLNSPPTDFLFWYKKPYEITMLPLASLGLSTNPSEMPVVLLISKQNYKVIDSYLNTYFPNVISQTAQCPPKCIKVLETLTRYHTTFVRIADHQQTLKTALHSIIPKGLFDGLSGNEKLKKIFDWFCNSYFHYFQTPKCHNCGQETMKQGTSPVIPSELEGLPTHAEIFCCPSCGAHVRFPRYTNPLYLLNNPYGDSAEGSIILLTIYKCLGYTARFVCAFMPHSWIEVYSEESKRYIPVDIIAKTFDCPLVYQASYKFEINWVVGVTSYEYVDVTERYVLDKDDLQDRRDSDEASQWITKVLAFKNTVFLSLLSQSERTKIKEMQKYDKESIASRSTVAEPKPEELNAVRR